MKIESYKESKEYIEKLRSNKNKEKKLLGGGIGCSKNVIIE